MAAENAGGLPDRGRTYLTGPNRTADSTATTSKGIEGIIKVFKDIDYSSTTLGIKPRRSAGEVTCILVRNASGIALLPKMTVVWKAGQKGKQVDGYAKLQQGQVAGVVDEWLPAAGCPNNDYFWLTVRGPTFCLTAKEADATNSIGEGEWLGSLTAANSTHSTTAGRVIPAIDVAGVTTNITFAASGMLNKIGRAMSARSTTSTNSNILVFMDLY